MPKRNIKPKVIVPEILKPTEITNIKKTSEELREEKKKRFLEYFADVPVQKIAASHIAVSEDTITDWKRADSNFSDQIEILASNWIRQNVKEVKSKEWLLERLFRQHFSPRTEITGADGKDLLPMPIMGGKTRDVSSNNNLPEITEPKQEN